MGIAYEMKELTRDIASSHKDRTKNIHKIGEEIKRTRADSRNMVHGFKGSRLEASRQLKSDLARDKTGRTSEVKAILKDSQVFLKDFENSRQVASARVRKDLSTVTAERVSEVKKTLEDAQNLLKNFQTNREETGSELRKGLALSRVGVELDVKQMRGVFQEARGKVRANLNEVKAAWQGLAGMIQAGAVRTAVSHKTEAPATQEGNRSLEAELLAVVNGYPAGGISLADLSGILRVAPVVLGRASKALINKGKIRKEGKLYFPASSGS